MSGINIYHDGSGEHLKVTIDEDAFPFFVKLLESFYGSQSDALMEFFIDMNRQGVDCQIWGGL